MSCSVLGTTALPSAVLDAKKLDTEWREHVFDGNLSPDLEWEKYWSYVKNAKVPSEEAKYPNLTKFVEVLASFPFPNAAVERIFSLLKRIKTDDRTRMKSSCLRKLIVQVSVVLRKTVG